MGRPESQQELTQISVIHCCQHLATTASLRPQRLFCAKYPLHYLVSVKILILCISLVKLYSWQVLWFCFNFFWVHTFLWQSVYIILHPLFKSARYELYHMSFWGLMETKRHFLHSVQHTIHWLSHPLVGGAFLFLLYGLIVVRMVLGLLTFPMHFLHCFGSFSP